MAAQDNVDDIVLSILGSSGFFVDAGCNSYVEQNNTYKLEQSGWQGIAIDAHSSYQAGYLVNRPNTKFIHSAIVGNEYNQDTIIFHGAGMVASCAEGASGDNSFESPARMLQDIFDENSITDIDFLSLDLEGFEHEAISGIDFSKTHIKLICAENHDVPNYLDYGYMESLGYDNFYTSKSPCGKYIWHRWFFKQDLDLNLDYVKGL